jgi:hypothetical protein
MSLVPSQVPFGLIIQDLPKEISSWLTCLLLNQPFKEQWSKAPTRSKLSLGPKLNTTCYPLAAKETLSSNNSLLLRDIKFSQPLLMQSEKEDLIRDLLTQSKQNQSEPPWIMWHRPLSWLTPQTHAWMMMGDLPSFYNVNSSSIQIMINQSDNNQLS